MNKLTSFRASRLKLSRASFHITSLRQLFTEYISREPLVAIVEKSERDAGWLYAKFLFRESIPDDASSILGDAVHNLRTCLDLLASDCARLNDIDPDKVYFPFSHNSDEIEVMIRRRNCHLLAPEVIELIRSFKPYRGGNADLRGIHDLDLIDKHSRPIPFATDISYRGSGMRKNLALVEGPRSFGGITGRPEQIEELGLSLGMMVPLDFKLIFEMRNNFPFEGAEILPTLERLHYETARIIDAFETLCFGAISK